MNCDKFKAARSQRGGVDLTGRILTAINLPKELQKSYAGPLRSCQSDQDMQVSELLKYIPNSDLIRIERNEEEVYAGYRGLLEEEIEGEVIRVSIGTEVWKREQKRYGLHKGEALQTERIRIEDMQQYDFRDLSLRLILKIELA